MKLRLAALLVALAFATLPQLSLAQTVDLPPQSMFGAWDCKDITYAVFPNGRLMVHAVEPAGTGETLAFGIWRLKGREFINTGLMAKVTSRGLPSTGWQSFHKTNKHDDINAIFVDHWFVNSASESELTYTSLGETNWDGTDVYRTPAPKPETCRRDHAEYQRLSDELISLARERALPK